ncbi:hypothetical protein GOBAR_AA04204 [Gossypium barbadense]|uniref:Uncharacterized protein n=1 Tax=Gossypium barbadense TaxID=3634 RepID=A0A2P5YLD2_GOSBA|nr:hypothetical protein GOBAR_AA04204 [Gossypium barbadense]
MQRKIMERVIDSHCGQVFWVEPLLFTFHEYMMMSKMYFGARNPKWKVAALLEARQKEPAANFNQHRQEQARKEKEELEKLLKENPLYGTSGASKMKGRGHEEEEATGGRKTFKSDKIICKEHTPTRVVLCPWF